MIYFALQRSYVHHYIDCESSCDLPPMASVVDFHIFNITEEISTVVDHAVSWHEQVEHQLYFPSGKNIHNHMKHSLLCSWIHWSKVLHFCWSIVSLHVSDARTHSYLVSFWLLTRMRHVFTLQKQAWKQISSRRCSSLTCSLFCGLFGVHLAAQFPRRSVWW